MKPFEDRRSARGAKGLMAKLRRIRGALRRPLQLQWHGLQLHVVLAERRRTLSEDRPPTLSQLRSELGARLLADDCNHAADVMRHLVAVHSELGQSGWTGVERLPPPVLAKALMQAEMLASAESSPCLTSIVERLRVLKVGAELREERKARAQAAQLGETPEVREATVEEFVETQRGWTELLSTEETAVSEHEQ